MNKGLILTISILIFTCCSTIPKNISNEREGKPDYDILDNWAAHPDKLDPADRVPGSDLPAQQDDLLVDVFFVHPTTYTKRPIDNQWNAPINDLKLNQRTDQSTILYQASIFNQAGRVFAPRYRQAHIKAFYVEDEQSVKRVFDIAYGDVKRAFLYYLKFYNDGRPFILASHSQGTTHTVRLIQEVIDGTDLEFKMVTAYLIGMPVEKNSFDRIKPCEGPRDLRCFVSWRTYKKGFTPDDRPIGDQYTVHNPLSWSMEDNYVGKNENKGAVIRKFDKVFDQATDAQVSDGILWAAKPKFPFSFFFTRKNYHIADLNFYYMNVCENAQDRVRQFLRLK